jgi:hypothetical protein
MHGQMKLKLKTDIKILYLNFLNFVRHSLFWARSQNSVKTTIRFLIFACMSVRPSTRNSAPSGRIFMKFEMRIFRKSVEKIQVVLKSHKNDRYIRYTNTYVHLLITSRSVLFRMRNISDKRAEKIKTHISNSITFFSKSRTVYEIMWENMVRAKQTTNGHVIRRMRFARWIRRATDTHSENAILIDFQRQRWLRERVSMLRVSLYLQYLSC